MKFEQTPGLTWWRRPVETYHYAEPAATEYQLLIKTYVYATIVPGALYVLNLSLNLASMAFPGTPLMSWWKWFKDSHWSWAALLACVALMIVGSLTHRRRFAPRLRAAYLAARRCPSCASHLTGPPAADGLTRCRAFDCGGAWSLPVLEAPDEPRLPTHPLACPRCDYDLHGVANFSPCPECGLALSPDLLVDRPVQTKLDPTKAPVPGESRHPDAIPPRVLSGPDLARYRRGLCPYCGYDRKGIAPEARCPECASTIARRAAYDDESPPPGSRPVCARCGFDMRGRERNRTCPDCGVMNGLRWVTDPLPS